MSLNLPDHTDTATAIRHVFRLHFEEAHTRVPDVYQRHFSSAKTIFNRHWQHKKDIPRDLMTLPKSIFNLGKKAIPQRYKKGSEPPINMSGKEQALLSIIQDDLLQLEALRLKVYQLLESQSPEVRELESVHYEHFSQAEQKKIELFISQKLASYSLPTEGSRDLLLFLMIGLAGKGVGQKVAFGSAIATGAAAAQSVYLAHQSWWSSIWLQWAGTPAWVSTLGAIGGLSLTIAIAPLLSPLAEIMVNRVRGEKHLHRIVDQFEQSCFEHKMDRLDYAGVAATYAQMAPDILQLIKSLRP